ncbi:MAG TPA: hypothetical protein LFW21_00520 [Rickettsia endosymbiont of Pyrocoelia pectoralis]|nr:hypothetical protein [Rickettsia endosymbiont of Pyrocoelia pectoralis]
MTKYRKQRNWSLYNQKRKKITRIDFFIWEGEKKEWEKREGRKAGAKGKEGGEEAEEEGEREKGGV